MGFYVAQYDGAIRYTSDQLTAFFAALRPQGLLDDTLVVLTSDHGEAFLEHGTLTHGDVLFDELVHVPLVIRTPDGRPRGRRVPNLTSLVDLAPTVLDYVGLPPPPPFQGRSLRPPIDGTTDADPDAVVLEAPDAIAIRTARWKVIVDRETGAEQLYDLVADPGGSAPCRPTPGRPTRGSWRNASCSRSRSTAASSAGPARPV